MKKNEDNPLLTKTMQFSVEIVKFSDELVKNHKMILANQILKSGTSIGANAREAQNSESKTDFIHKLKISAKEIEETQYWLELISKVYEQFDVTHMESLLDEVARIVNAIITTSKKSLKN